LIVTNRLGCQDTAEVEITESESLVFSISGDSTICNGESTVLSVELGSGYKYKWSTGDTTSSIIINNSGILWVEIENDNGCKGYDTMEVVIFPRPEARIEAVSGEIFCWGDTLRLDALPDNPLFKYSWSTSDTSSQLRVTNYELGINKYWVIVESEYGCKDTAYKDIFVNPVPEFDILGVVEICPGDTSTLSIDKEFSSYIWSTGDTTKDITVTNAGIYFVKVIDTNGCSRYDSVEVRMRDIDISGINDLNFGQIKVGTSKPLQLNIKNSGEEIRIKDVNIKNQPVVFSLQTNPQVPFILNPQGTITITINFSPLEIKNYKDTLIIELDEPCAIKYSSLLEGNSIFGGKLFVSLPDTSGNVNDLNFRIPLKAYIKDKAKVSGLSYKAEIRWDASAFPPDELKSPDIKSNKIENNERVITLEGINVDMDETEREIGSVTGSIFLANQTVTLLRITRFELSDTTMDFEKKDGSIRQVGVCSESIRKISLFQPLEFTLQPNPASDELIITMKGEKGVEYSINLYSSQGEQINKLSVKLEEREIAVKMDVSQLPPGLYFVRIGNGIGMFVKNN
jgi:hypothetical protein